MTLGCQDLSSLFRGYMLTHLTVRELTPALKLETAKQYLKALDGSKSMLLKSDVEAAEKKLVALFDQMKSGKCDALNDIQKVASDRAAENEAYVKGFMGADYKLDETIVIQDADKRDYPADKAAREDLLRRSAHFQVSNYLLSDVKLPEAKTQLVHRYELVTKRYRERKPVDLINAFVEAFAIAMDPHSSFFSRQKLEDFQIDMRLSLEGIGASLSSQDGFTVVEEIITGGAADKAKVLQPKDKIVAVRQVTDGKGKAIPDSKPQAVIDMDLNEVVRLIRGPKDSVVELTLLRKKGDQTERTQVQIKRAQINLADQAAKLTMETRKVDGKTLKIGVIRLPSFYGESGRGKVSSSQDIKKLLVKAKAQKVDGIVLNLAGNGGGLLDEAVKISGLFIRKGAVVGTKNSGGQWDVLADQDEETVYSGPLVVLTSRFSASASEILAGALKDYRRALIVGADHTFGKGTVQVVMELPRGAGALKVTNAMFFIPGGATTQHNGVAADVVIPGGYVDKVGERFLENSVPPQKVAPFLGAEANSAELGTAWTAISGDLVPRLSERSKTRVAASPKFQEIEQEAAEARQSDGSIRLADVRKRSVERKAKDKNEEKKSFATRVRDAELPYVNEAVDVAADLVLAQRGGVAQLPLLQIAKPKETKPAPGKPATGTASVNAEKDPPRKD